MDNYRIGELFVLGFQGRQTPPWLRRFESRFGLGGIILFDYDFQAKTYDNNIHSPQQVKALCGELCDLPSRPLLMVDQEGGRVRRLKEKLGFAPLPSAQAMSSLPLAEREAILRRSFSELRELGFHFDLAPVVDINLNARNPDIGAVERSYSADYRVVREHALTVDRIAREVGLGLCLKHFPGLGSATTNSHLDLTDVTDALTDNETTIFYELGPRVHGSAILLSHAFNRRWDDQNPVSLSAAAITRLRERVPKALLLSDDLQMQGLQKLHLTIEACPLALRAGLDCLVIGNNLMREQAQLPAIAESLLAECERDPILRQNVQASLQRVHERKKMFYKRFIPFHPRP